jgi:hypothetical protein
MESYRLWCVVVCDLETSEMRRPWPTEGCCATKKKLQVVKFASIISWDLIAFPCHYVCVIAMLLLIYFPSVQINS